MQITAGKDENGFDIRPAKSGIPAQKVSKHDEQGRLQSFVKVSLYTFMFVGIFAVVWLYMGSKSLSQVFGEIVAGEESAVGGLEAIGEKPKLPENKIANPESLPETSDTQHESLAVQNQKLVAENKALIATNEELRVRVETLSNQFDKVNEVYLKRLASMGKPTVSPVVESSAPKVQVVGHAAIVMPQPQDLNEELVNENKVLIAQNRDLARRNYVLINQMDKTNKVYLKRLASMVKAADNSVAKEGAPLEQEVPVGGQDTTAKPQKQDQRQALVDANAALVIQYEELVKKVIDLSGQLDKSNEFYRRQLTEWQTQNGRFAAKKTWPAATNVQRRRPGRTLKWQKVAPKKQVPTPWKGTSVAELLLNVKPAAEK